MFKPNILIGDILTNSDILNVFGCQDRFGIRLNKKNNAIVLVSDATSKNMYADKWNGDVLYYTGTDAGAVDGNQTLTGPGNNNGALKAVWDNPETTLFLFVKHESNQYTYKGRVKLDREPYQAPRETNPLQLVWKFPLKLIDTSQDCLKNGETHVLSQTITKINDNKAHAGGVQMIDFKKQIMEDIIDYRLRYPNIANMQKDEWAFNFWVLDNLFSEEEEIIEEKIIDYNDKGIDCYVWHEDLHDLYLIQNKFYSEGTPITNSYVQNDFLTRALGALEKGTYSRSKELQDIYTKYSGEDDFCIHFHLYVTSNSSVSKSVFDGVAKFNQDNAAKRVDAKIFQLDEIQTLYYKEPLTNKKTFKYTMKTINKGTELSINNAAYKMTLAIDAKYVLTPVVTIYNLYKEAQKQKYPLFDENIREYLGSSGAVNKKIVATLKDPNDRSNFFFYNNGITMIVNDMSSATAQSTMRTFDVFGPQIVNGCQTVSTIYETLASLPEDTLEEEFSSTFVMVKILKIPADNAKLHGLYRNIVTYNNSQNSINEKAFIAIQDVFKHVQSDFEWRGFLVCIKQSDKHTFANKYKTATPLLNKNAGLLSKYKLTNKKKTSDFQVDLEKLLQVFLSFISTPQDAIQNKSKLLKDQSTQNKRVVEFIKGEATANDLLNLYLLYLRAEQEKAASPDGKIPNAFYLVYCFSRYECHGDSAKITELLNDGARIDEIIKRYALTFKRYYNKWVKANPGKEYNDMIKAAVDTALLDECKADIEEMLTMM